MQSVQSDTSRGCLRLTALCCVLARNFYDPSFFSLTFPVKYEDASDILLEPSFP